MSMPSASYLVHMGVMACSASAVSRQERPAMLPESSIRNIVSKVARKEKSVSVGSVVLLLGRVMGCGVGKDCVRGGAAL